MAKLKKLLLAWALLPLAAAANSGLKELSLVPPPSNTGAVAPSAQASTLREPQKKEGQTLRCWQNGRLLFEEPGFKSQGQPDNTVMVQRHDGTAVTVFDNKDALCILSAK